MSIDLLGIKILFIAKGIAATPDWAEAGLLATHVEDAAAGEIHYQTSTVDVVVVSDVQACAHTWVPEAAVQTPLVIVGNSSDPRRIVKAMQTGAADYILNDCPDLAVHLPVAVREAYQRWKTQEKQKQFESLRIRNQHLEQLNRASQLLAATLDSQKVMTQMLIEVTDITNAKDASVWAWEDERREFLVCRATSNVALLETLQKHRVQRGTGIAGWVVESGKSAVVSNTQRDKRFLASVDEWTGFQTESVLAVPLKVHDDVVGVLEILNKDASFNDEDIALAETLTASATIALENARLVERLQAQTSELHARNADLDAFARTVAHDLKTPLNWVSGYAELLIKDWDVLSDTERREYAQAALNGAHTMENIIDDLLLLASLHQAEVVIEPVDMHSVARRARQRLAPMVAQYEAEIVCDVELPMAMGYGSWIEGVWVNYLSNALKYGGRPPKVELGFTDRRDGFMTYWVMDNGNGLSEAQQAELFEPFTRLERDRVNGHGLGLSIVRRIVEKLGGQVGVESIVGRGSCFSFSLPKV